jgi:hypothetical protein
MDIQRMQKLIALSILTAFVGVGSLTLNSPASFAADEKKMVSACDKITNEKKHEACMKREAAKAAKKAKKDAMKKAH